MEQKEFVDLIGDNILLMGWFGSRVKIGREKTGHLRQYTRILVWISLLGDVKLKDVARHCDMPVSNLCTMLKDMEQDGLVLSKRDAVDRRNVWYSLTTEGKSRARKEMKRLKAIISKMFGELDAKDETHLTDALRTLNAILGKIKDSYKGAD